MPKIQSILTLISLLTYTGGLLASDGTGSGTVQQVSGDLAYVTGLNGSAPLWSTLVVQNGHTEGAQLEVIKELAEMLVARVVDASGTGVILGS